MLINLFGFLLGILLNVPTGLPGKLRVGELLMFAIVPIAYVWLNRSDTHYPRKINSIVLCLAGLFFWHGFVDILLGTPFMNMVDVAATFGFSGMKLYILAAMFLRAPSSTVPTLIGISIGQFFFAEEIPSNAQLMEVEYWDLKVAAWAGPLLMAGILITGKYLRLFVVLAILLYGGLAAYYGARSHGLTMIVSIGIPYLVSLAKRFGLTDNKRSLMKLAAICGFILLLMSVVYVEAARAGLLTKKSQNQLLSIKNPYNPIELIWSGRAGTMIGLMGVVERPIFGYGSMQFKSHLYYRGMAKEAWTIIHSMVIESLVYAGVVAIVFWIAFGHYVFQLYPATSSYLKQVSHYNILATIAIVTLTWGMFFSPLVSARFEIPFCVSVIMHCQRMLQLNSNRGVSQQYE